MFETILIHMFETIFIQIFKINMILIVAIQIDTQIDTRNAKSICDEMNMKIARELVNMIIHQNLETISTRNRMIIFARIVTLVNQMLGISLETSISHLNHLLRQKDLIQKS
jgi:hypothetical protein